MLICDDLCQLWHTPSTTLIYSFFIKKSFSSCLYDSLSIAGKHPSIYFSERTEQLLFTIEICITRAEYLYIHGSTVAGAEVRALVVQFTIVNT